MLWRCLLILWVAQVFLIGGAAGFSQIGQWLVWRDFRRQAAGFQEMRDIPYAAAINRYAATAGINPLWAAAITGAESSYNPRALSGAGAYGLMQVSPSTWNHVNQRLRLCRDRHAGDCTAACYFDPELNLQIGMAYLEEMMQKYNDPVLATAAYNAGPGAVDRAGGIPAIEETRKYVVRVACLCSLFASGVPPAGASIVDAAMSLREVAISLWYITSLLLLTIAVRLRVKRRSWRWR